MWGGYSQHGLMGVNPGVRSVGRGEVFQVYFLIFNFFFPSFFIPSMPSSTSTPPSTRGKVLKYDKRWQGLGVKK